MSNQEHLALAADFLERYLRWEGNTSDGVVYLRGLLKAQLELHLEPVLNLLKETKCET